MRYVALLYGEETEAYEAGTEELAQELRAYEEFSAFAGAAILGGEALESAASAITMCSKGGDWVVTDGPFIESAEVTGGMFVLEADDLDEALELARRIPAAHTGAVELRPLVEWFDRSQDFSLPVGASRYLALLYEIPSDADVPGTAAWEEGARAHERFGERAGDALLAGAALHPGDTATTLRVREGELLVTDGPFAETTEVVGGLYCLWAGSREEALALARHLPVGDGGAVELRPIMELDPDRA